jgi:hypothetical protein
MERKIKIDTPSKTKKKLKDSEKPGNYIISVMSRNK